MIRERAVESWFGVEQSVGLRESWLLRSIPEEVMKVQQEGLERMRLVMTQCLLDKAMAIIVEEYSATKEALIREGEENNVAIPVLVWTNKDLSRDEHLGLHSSVQGIIQEGAGTAELIAVRRGYLHESKRRKTYNE